MDEDIDPDAPRVAQWEPDDFEVNSDPQDEDTSEEEDQPEEKTAGPSQVHLVSDSRDQGIEIIISDLPIRNHSRPVCQSVNHCCTRIDSRTDLSILPLGALRKAQRALALAQAESDFDEDGDSSDGEISAGDSGKVEQKRPEWNTNPRRDLAKRSSKHAYVYAYFSMHKPQMEAQATGGDFKKTSDAQTDCGRG